MDRRDFLQGISAGVIAGASKRVFALGKEPSANDRIAIGVIGPGSRGQELIRQLLRVPGVEIAAVADIYQPRFAQVDKLTGKPVPAHKDYRELLARKDLDAIVVSTPLACHAEHVSAALATGRPVYGEKSMAFTPDECQALLKDATQPDRIFQIGHEYRYAAWFQAAIDRVQKGEIGQPLQVYAYWHRNSDWRRPVPDPSLEHLINWRLYRETSGGLLTELGSHHIDIANWVFEEQPQSVLGSSSIARWRDGRTVGDNVQAVFNYSAGRHLMFSSITDNAYAGNQLWIYGTEGSVQLTIEDATFYYEPKKAKALPSTAEVLEHGIVTGASYQTTNEMPYRGPGAPVKVADAEDPTYAALHSFVECVKNRKQPFADALIGFASAIAAATANRAIDEGRVLEIPKPAAEPS